MKYNFAVLFLFIGTSLLSQSSNIWVVSNILISESDREISRIISNTDYEADDILVFHGNAMTGLDKIEVNNVIRNLRQKFERVYIVPGEEDWEQLRSKKLKSLGDYLDDEYKGDVIVPENACGNVEVKKINEDLSIVFMDSDWYFSDWSDDKYANRKCDVTSRETFWTELGGEIGALKAKQVILFARNPIMRNDDIGGHLDARDHLFPLADWIPGAYIPLPIIGTLVSDTRSYLTSRSNLLSPLYQDYINQIKILLKNHSQLTLVTSDALINSVYGYHDNYQINVNTSKKKSSLHDDERLIYQNDDRSILQLAVADQAVRADLIDVDQGEKKYSHTVLDGKPLKYNADDFRDFDSSTLDTYKERRIRLSEDRVRYSSLIFGGLNKELYDREVSVPKINLDTYKGGLQPLRMGGGKQTNSLRLQDKDGYVYVARSLKKNPEKALPPGINIKPLHKTMENFFMAADPLAFLTTPVLDSAANVYHTTPRLLHLPKQPKLGVYNDKMGGELVLFRERADEAWPEKSSYGYSEDIISSNSMIDKMADNKANPDDKMFLRARLLDLVIGDWDRHKDQWRWAEGTGQNNETYHPIARDRDQVYANFDGLLIKLLRPYSINLLQLRKFDDRLDRDEIRWMHWKSAILDNFVLNNLSEKEWNAEKEYVKAAMSAEVIDRALSRLPDSYSDRKEVIKKNVTARFDNLDQISDDFRAELLHTGVVRASNDSDSIIITQYDENSTIEIFRDYKDDNIYEKYEFSDSETHEVWVYGLEGDDVFVMRGVRRSNTDLILIGGYNEDRYYSTDDFSNIEIIDDEPREKVTANTPTYYRYETSKNVHDINRNDLLPAHKFLIPVLAYNTDDGVNVGGAYHWVFTGFKNKVTHRLSADYMTRRRSSMLSYSYMKDDLLSNISTYADVKWSGVRRQLNYYGGMGSANNGNNDFYRIGLSDIRVDGGKIKNINNITALQAGVLAWSTKVEDNPNNFVANTDIVDDRVFDREYFGGANISLTLQNSDNPMRPTKSAKIKLGAEYKYAVVSERSNIKFDFEYEYYKPLIGEDRLIFSTKLWAGHLIGDYYFFEGYQLGGNHYLRGYRNGRFTGRSIVAQNTNLQLKIVDHLLSKDYKFSAGISGAFDHGRTWSDFDIVDKWQYTYGGGIWISPLDMAVISSGVYFSDEDLQVRIRFNWQF